MPWCLDSPRVQLIRRLFDLMEANYLVGASEELLAHCADGRRVRAARGPGPGVRGQEELRRFWAGFADDGVQMRAGAYSVTEEDDSVVVTRWVRSIKDGRLADTQSRWVYRFNDDDQVIGANTERA
jgi:hypothetical protein